MRATSPRAIRTGSSWQPKRSDLVPARGAEKPILRWISFSDIRGWHDDDHAAAFGAFFDGARRIADRPPKTRALGIEGSRLQRVARAALAAGRTMDRETARAFFERHFAPCAIATQGGFVTGYFEPELEASRVRTERFRVPLYRRPPDLVDVSDANRPAGWDPDIRFAQQTPDGLRPFFDRAAIEDGALSGRGLELAWLESPVDAFFVHVQGSARLRIAEGEALRIGFDGKSGHPYVSIGRLAVERGLLSLAEADKDGLEAWLKAHPREARALMRENRSYIFFRETEARDDEGPLGAAGVALTAFRSLAVDRSLHTFHTPLFVDVPKLADPSRSGHAFRRLMIAHDTGSAIIGPARGDIFFGSGGAAGSLAGRVRHDATMILLAPAEAADA